MSISNVNSALAAAYLNQLSAAGNAALYGRSSTTCPTCQSFYSVLQSQLTDQNKQNAIASNTGKSNTINSGARLLYQNLLMQRAGFMPYGMNYYSGYNNLYGLSGVNNYSMLQNSLYSSILGNL